MNPGNLQPWTLNSGWECVWPSEAVSRTMACPMGWNGGNYMENQRYEIRDCGSALVRVSRTLVGTSPCTSDMNGATRSTPCPTGWTGNYTEQEIITQVLPEPWNVGNILTQSTRWVMVDSTQCSRERIETTTEACPFGGTSQTKQRKVRETMAPNLSSVQTSGAGAWSVVAGTECPTVRPCPAGWESLPNFYSNATHCWYSVQFSFRCIEANLWTVPRVFSFDRRTGATRDYDSLNTYTSWVAPWELRQLDSPECLRPCPSSFTSKIGFISTDDTCSYIENAERCHGPDMMYVPTIFWYDRRTGATREEPNNDPNTWVVKTENVCGG
jgi:hypothetical protein